MTCPMRHRNMTTISEMGPRIAVGSTKAQGLKVKPVYGSEPPRATRARDEETQRMANILVHPVRILLHNSDILNKTVGLL
jgi:hypothetical protein